MQEYSSFWCVISILLLWKDIVAPTLGKICLPSYHRFITNQQTYSFFNRKDFQPNITGEYSLPMVLDRKIPSRSRLIVGGKNNIYFLNDVSLEINSTYTWTSDQIKLKTCLSRPISKDLCANYINFMAIHKNKLMVCGTNSMSPKSKLISLNTFETLKERNDRVCSSHRSISMVGEITELGELIAGNYKYFAGNNPVIGKVPVISGTIIDNSKILRKALIADQSFQVNQPEFIASASVDDSVYIFMMEKAAENNDVYTATVVRLCTTDSGGSRQISTKMWTTFRKTRLVCEIKQKDNQQIFKFQNLVDVVYDKIRKVFHATFTMFKFGNMHSALCTFWRLDIDNTFNGRFLDTSKLDDKVHPVDNGNFLFGCKVNPANLSKSNTPIGGKQPTNFLKMNALNIAKQYALMEHKVYNRPDEFEFMQSMTSFSKLTLDQVGRTNANQIYSPVLNIGTKSGSILMVYKYKQSEPCIIEEISTDVGEMKNMLFNEDKRILYISSSSRVIALDVDNCGRYGTKFTCVQAHNPRCGWSLSIQQCIPISDISDLSKIEQDLTTCAKRSDFFRPWSGWSPCEYAEKKYCLCRHRSCDSCNTSLCKNGSYSEVKNCTVNELSNVTRWLVEGSVDGKWSKWGNQWSVCHNSLCGNNTMSLIRNCTSPRNGGRKCLGNNFQCKSCPKDPIIIKPLWGGWSIWGACMKMSSGYIQQRSRNCSKPSSCVGSTIGFARCIPSGIEWGKWTICTCLQRVQHRYPVFINGCNNCTQLKLAHYRVCTPGPECSTKIPTTSLKITTASVTTSKSTTTKSIDTTSSSSSTSSSTSSTSSSTDMEEKTIPSTTTNAKTQITPATTTPNEKTIKSTAETMITVIPPHYTCVPVKNNCDPDNKYTLLELLIICACIIVPCFIISALVIYFSSRKNNSSSHESEKIPLNNHQGNIA